MHVVIQESELVRKWLQSNRLSLSINKTSYMKFDRHEMDVQNKIYVSNISLQSTEDIRFFGIIIYCKLNFNKHVNNVLNKVNKVSGMICRGRNILSQKIHKMLYLSLAWPQLTH